MARTKAPKQTSSSGRDPCQCPECPVFVARKSDMPRHLRTHAKDKEDQKHRCPWPDCDFASLQRCNVRTHIRTHTKEKSQCPFQACGFATTDPGSLTRHRKRIHGYIPPPRKPRARRPGGDENPHIKRVKELNEYVEPTFVTAEGSSENLLAYDEVCMAEVVSPEPPILQLSKSSAYVGDRIAEEVEMLEPSSTPLSKPLAYDGDCVAKVKLLEPSTPRLSKPSAYNGVCMVEAVLPEPPTSQLSKLDIRSLLNYSPPPMAPLRSAFSPYLLTEFSDLSIVDVSPISPSPSPFPSFSSPLPSYLPMKSLSK